MQQTVHHPPIAYCRICGRQLVVEEQHQAFGSVYCADHLPAGATADQAGSPWTPGHPGAFTSRSGVSPGLAFILGLIPGVGAIYNAQYAKGLIHVVVFGLLISLASSDLDDFQPLFGILIPTWVIYMAFEAFHTAKRRESGQALDEFSSVFALQSYKSGTPVGAVILIGVGIIFLLHNFGWLRLSELLRLWPLILIGVGAYRLYVRFHEPQVPPSTPPSQEIPNE